MRDQFVQTVKDLMKEDEKLFLLLGDIGVHGFRDVLKEYPLRAYNIGICEQAMIGLAAGLVMTGFTPVAHSIAPFLVERAYEQLKIDFGYQRLGGNFVSVGGSYDYDKLGSTHHCSADVSILSQIPGMQIVVPGTAKEFDILFKKHYANGLPTYYRLSKYINDTTYDVKFGRVLPLDGTGFKCAILAIGPALQWVLNWRNSRSDGNKIKVLYANSIDISKDVDLVKQECSSDKLIVVEPFYPVAFQEIIKHIRADWKVISVAPDKRFVDVGFDLEKHLISKLNIIVPRSIL